MRFNMFFKGFRFGMLLQLAVGPICLFIFQTSAVMGFWPSITGVFGVALADASYIIAAILGLGVLIDKYKSVKKLLKYFGAAVLIIYGLNIVLSVKGFALIPSLSLPIKNKIGGIFFKTLFLTLSNPLTVIFWAGVFSTKIVEEEWKKTELYQFGLGAVSSTVFFLTLVSLLGNLTNMYLPTEFLNYLNLFIGLVFIVIGTKTAIKNHYDWNVKSPQ